MTDVVDAAPTTDHPDGFQSLAALRSAHLSLLRQETNGAAPPSWFDQIAQFIQRGATLGALLDGERDRAAAQTILDYWNTRLYRSGVQPPDSTLAEFDPSLAPMLPDELCPYVGLDAFREATHELFFGRESLIAQMLETLRDGRLLVAVGPSGSGKSSVVQGGVVPALRQGALPGSARWRICGPVKPGADPHVALAKLFPPGTANVSAQRFLDDTGCLRSLIDAAGDSPAVVVVDQFEEIFTLCADDRIRSAFVANLVALLEDSRAGHRVIVTLRSDFEPQLRRLPGLGQLVDAATVRVMAMSAAELKEAIERPAERVGLKFQEGIVEGLVRDILGEPAGLPLLQFSLLKLWEKREHNRVSLLAYEELGGARGALARSADALYASLLLEDRETVRRILLAIARPGEGLEVTSRRLSRAEIHELVGEDTGRIDRVLARLVHERLVRLTPGDTEAEDQFEVAHEALLRNWPRLVEWLEQERVSARQRLRLAAAASEWVQRGRDDSYLLRGTALAEAQALTGLPSQLQKFVDASARKVESDARRKLRAAVSIAVVSGALAVAAIISAGAFLVQKRQAEEAAQVAQQQTLVATAQRLSSESFNRLSEQLDLSLLLAVEATRNAAASGQDSARTDAGLALLAGLTYEPRLETFLRWDSAEDHAHWSPSFSRDGARVAVGGDDGTLSIWDVQQRTLVMPPIRVTQVASSGTGPPVWSVAFSPVDAQTLATGDDEGHVKVWNLNANPPAARQLDDARYHHTQPVRAVAFSADGKELASAGWDGQVIKWSLPDGGAVQLGSAEMQLWSVAFSPNPGPSEELAVGGANGHVLLWKTLAGAAPQPIDLTLHTQAVRSVAFSHDGRYLATGSEDHLAKVWDTASLNAWKAGGPPPDPHLTLAGHTDWVNSVAFSVNDAVLASGSNDTTVRLWSVPGGDSLGAPLQGHRRNVRGVAFRPGSPVGELVSASDDGTLIEWNPIARWPLGTGRDGWSIAFSPDGGVLAAAPLVGPISLWDPISRTPLPTPAGTDAASAVAFSQLADGRPLLAAGATDRHPGHPDTGRVLVWPFQGNQPQAARDLGPVDRPVTRVAFSRSASAPVLVALSEDESTHTGELIASDVDPSTGAPHERARTPVTGAVAWSLDVSPDGTTIAVGLSDRTVRLFTLGASGLQPTGKPLTGHISDVWSVAFSPDGRILAAGSNGSIALWDVATRTRVGPLLVGHHGDVRDVAFSSDGRLLASVGLYGDLALWDVQSQQRIGPAFTWHAGAAQGVAFSPGDDFLATAGDRPAVTLVRTGVPWKASAPDLEARACAVAARNLSVDEWQAFVGDAERAQPACPNAPVRQPAAASAASSSS